MPKINRILRKVIWITNSLLCFRDGNGNLGATRAGVTLCLLLMVLFSGAELKAEMSYLNNGVIQIGVDISKGGSITFLADADQLGINMVNSYDLGREIQQAYYSGPIPFGNPHPHWADVGWNPLCAGDCYGNPSEVVEYSNDGTTLYVKTIPKHWPLNNVPAECIFEKWITLCGNVAKVSCRMVNNRTDTVQYPARGQEVPAVLSTDIFYRVFTYAGDAPFTNGALTQMPSCWPGTYADATENWAALVDDSDWGFGVFHPGVQWFAGGFFGTPKESGGNPLGNSTGYLSPRYREILDYNIEYTYEFYLIVGNLGEIRSYVYQHQPANSLPDYRFEQDRQHWAYHSGTTDTGWPIEGKLRVNLDNTDPFMVGPAGIWAAEDVPKLYIRASYYTTCTWAEIFWMNFGDSAFTSGKRQVFAIIPDGQYHTYEVDLSSNPSYSGKISQLRFDPVVYDAPGEFVDIKFISYPLPIPGDFDRDKDVDVDDLSFLCRHWLDEEAGCLGDLDDDCYVRLPDFAVFAQHWLEGK